MSLNLLPSALRAFDESEEYVTPERRLMMATIVTALADATGQSYFQHADDRERSRKAALRWFRDAGADFQHVCHLAGLEPSNVRRAALDFIASGDPIPRCPRRTKVGSFAPRKPKPARFGVPIAQIAASAGVSPSAVRNVLSGTGSASRDMQHRVRRAHRELNEQREAA